MVRRLTKGIPSGVTAALPLDRVRRVAPIWREARALSYARNTAPGSDSYLGSLTPAAAPSALPQGIAAPSVYPDGSSVSFAYTPTGRRSSFTDDRGTTTYAHDLRDRVTLLTYPDGRSLAYAYDALGHRASLTANVGGQALTTSYGFDELERPAQVIDPLGRSFTTSYDAASRMVAMTSPNGTTTAYGYDARNRSTSIATTGPGNSVIQSYALTPDAAGRRLAIAEGDGTQKTYGYDAVDRLVSETVSGGSGPQYGKTFTYDAVGNRLQQDTTGDGAASVNYRYDSRDRLLSEGSMVYSSDANGNVTSRSGEAVYEWDDEQRLVRVEMGSGAKVEHAYDPEGNRVSTTVTPAGGAATKTDYLVDTIGGLGHAVADSTGGVLATVYVRTGDLLLAVVRPAGAGWEERVAHGDYIGSVRTLTDEAGLVAAVRGYEAFGARNSESGSDMLAYGFAGEPFDRVSGLAYHRARWLDARMGRFISEDPLVWSTDRDYPIGSLYAYGGNNPISMIDPSGKEFSLGGLGAALAGYYALAVTANVTLDYLSRRGFTAEKRKEFADYAVLLVKAKGGDCQDLVSLIRFAGSLWNDHANEMRGLFEGLTEFNFTFQQTASNPDLRVGVLAGDSLYHGGFSDDGFKKEYKEAVRGPGRTNQVRHFVAYLGTGYQTGNFYLSPLGIGYLRTREDPSNENEEPDFWLGVAGVQLGAEYNGWVCRPSCSSCTRGSAGHPAQGSRSRLDERLS